MCMIIDIIKQSRTRCGWCMKNKIHSDWFIWLLNKNLKNNWWFLLVLIRKKKIIQLASIVWKLDFFQKHFKKFDENLFIVYHHDDHLEFRPSSLWFDSNVTSSSFFPFLKIFSFNFSSPEFFFLLQVLPGNNEKLL